MKTIKTAKYKTMAQKVDGYFQGDAYKLTGKATEVHGGNFLEAILLEGHRKGELIVVPSKRHPELTST